MLQLLHIENIAVIEQADIMLENGFTVMSGETGTGKSIVIDAIGAILGKRVSKDLVRSGTKQGFVSAVFTEISSALAEQLDALDLAGEETDKVYIQRQITADGKSSCRVNMKPVTVSILRELSAYLIDIHGQNDGQKLLNEQYHIDYLDHFASNHELLEEYIPLYQKLRMLKNEITMLETGEQERLQRVDMLLFHKEEIENAALQKGEDELLLQRKTFFDHAGKVAGALEQAKMFLAGDDETAGACALLDSASDALLQLTDISDAYEAITNKAEEIRYLASDLKDMLSGQLEHMDFSQAEREQVELRLDEIYRLKQKYGASIEEILSYFEKISNELETLQDSDTKREELREEYRMELARAKKNAAKLTESRREAAKSLEKQIVCELAELDMEKVRMRIAVNTGTKLTMHGFDAVSFEISVNPGEPEKPLSKVASGGELSRIMLALKNVLTQGEDVDMLIFDEIDTGVSGHAAQQIGKKLAAIAKKKQTLCVTHLPQIAAMGDYHLLISKAVKENRSFTEVKPMNKQARIDEIARLLSGEQISEAARRNAEELLTAAAKEDK